ncbi:MAG TPA: UDP-N-acetylglucosamine 2-epimerase (non-hydrolyzing) [Candidatus Competibacteraceae bacterium]|nr:UDP-N-acetylglucosamine 2-epimerase (non-hydrolyzing) [Candidatus Competibacteraceae bacterium]
MTVTTPKILCVVGARPNFMKIAPIMAALHQTVSLNARLVHTGQHYDVEMNQRFFEQLGIPNPDMDLEVGSASHAVQTAEIMKRFEPVVDAEQPAAVLVVGDVNSTIACALVAAKKGVKVIHVEAGLRSFDRAMPEEINRVLTDQISDLLFTTEREALTNLTREGIDPAKIQFAGNVMIDTLRSCLPRAVSSKQTLAGALDPAVFLGNPNGYGILTLHRPSNVDDPVILERLLKVLSEISSDLPLVFPIHPRTRAMIDKAGLSAMLGSPRFCCLPPLGYLEMLGLMQGARMALTDSGGVQEETTALGVPCLTLRENTERPVTVIEGTNTIVGADPERIRSAAQEVLASGGKAGRIPEYWDGHAAERIAEKLAEWL